MVIVNCCESGRKHHAKGMCITCYKKNIWKRKLGTCINCKNTREIHAKKLCRVCYTKLWRHSLTLEDLPKYKECLVCGSRSLIHVHHMDKNRSNNNDENLISLCSHHHHLIHSGSDNGIKIRKIVDMLLDEI